MIQRLLPGVCAALWVGAAALTQAQTLPDAQSLPASPAPALPAALLQVLQRERIPADAVAVLVQEVGAATPRLTWQAQKPVNPASLMKLLTTHAALDLLGPGYVWKTPVWLAARPPASGAVAPVAGVLDGNLHLQGRGDPKLTLERLWLLVQRLRQMGIAEIRGDIVIDQGAFANEGGSTAEFDNEPLRPYNVRAQALLLNLGAVLYTFTPDPVAGVARVSAEPALSGVTVDASVPLVAGPCNDWRAGLKATPGDLERMQFSGSYPASCGERLWPLAYADSKLYAARLLATLWRDAGGRLTGSVREGPAPLGLKPAFEISSPALAEVVRDINKYSNNVMAQQLLLTLALPRPGGPAAAGPQASAEGGREALRQWLALRLGEQRGLRDARELLQGVVIDNGSGLSRETRLSAALLGRLLQSAWASPVMPELMASLPVAGIDGTLRNAQAATGMAHLKTGSLRDVAGVAGYVLGASGRRYVLVAIVNHPNANAARPALDALLQWTVDDSDRTLRRPSEPSRRISR